LIPLRINLDEKQTISQARTFRPWSHVVALLYAQLTHAIGLNDVCDGLTHHDAQLSTIRGVSPPAKNTLSHANKTRDSDMMEELCWEVLKHFQNNTAHFGNRSKGLPKRFKKAFSAIDSSTIALIANCMSWVKHRRRKAAPSSRLASLPTRLRPHRGSQPPRRHPRPATLRQTLGRRSRLI